MSRPRSHDNIQAQQQASRHYLGVALHAVCHVRIAFHLARQNPLVRLLVWGAEGGEVGGR